jgi:undecaprenyl-diphosphatase
MTLRARQSVLNVVIRSAAPLAKNSLWAAVQIKISSQMIFDFIGDITTMALTVAGLYLAIGFYVRHRRSAWSEPMGKHRFAILIALVFVVTAIKVTEDVIGRESGRFDEAVLMFVHSHVPSVLIGFFQAATFTASFEVLFPLATLTTIGMLIVGRRLEALLVGASVISAAIVVYVIKTAVGRARPELWDTAWYWGSSFPSGHTLVTAAFATAVALCVNRICPAARPFALPTLLSWIFVVALSRLVLGVHWPTDVLAAACIGAFLPLAISVALEFQRAEHESSDT